MIWRFAGIKLLCGSSLFAPSLCSHSTELSTETQGDAQCHTGGTCVSLSASLPPRFLLPCFSRWHIMSPSLTGHVATCRLGFGPSVCWEEGDICWAKWTEDSGNWVQMPFFFLTNKQSDSKLFWTRGCEIQLGIVVSGIFFFFYKGHRSLFVP